MSLVVLPRQLAVDINGTPRVAARMYFYAAGTSTPIVTYTTPDYAIPHAQPVESVSGGLFPAVYVNPQVNESYKVVVTDAAGVVLWTEDQVPTLGFSANDVAVFIVDELLALITPRSAAEIAAGVTPANYRYGYGHAFRYMTLAQSTSVLAGTLVDVTTALQTWGNLCISAGYAGFAPAGTYAVSSELLFTLPGNRTTQDLTLNGAGEGKTRFLRIGSQTSILRVLGGGGPSEAQVSLKGFATVADEVGAASILRDCDGITLQDIAIWSLDQVRTQYCRRNLSLDGAILGHINDCNLSDGRIGVYARNSSPGTQSDNNSITFSGNTRVNNNLETAFDIGRSSMVYATAGVNVERNGIAAAAVTITNASPGVVTYTASDLLVDIPVVFTTTGGLPTGLTAGTTYYVKTVLTANTFTVAATIGGAAINTSSAGSGVHTCTPQTHGVIVRNTCDDLIGVAAVHLEGLWIESNFGGWGIYNEGLTEGVVTIEKCEILQINGIKCVGGRSIVIRDVVNSANTNYDITSEYAEISNVAINSITDGVTYPDYRSFRTAAVNHVNGRVGSYTGTLTDCTTAPTGTIATIQRGKTVTASLMTPLTATSATTAAPTITGMPAAIRPASAKQIMGVNTDNSVDKVSQCSVATTGVITLINGTTSVFTAALTKGTQFFRGDWEIA